MVGAAVALINLRAGRFQRAQDLRWKQADAGKKLNDEMLTDVQALAAMDILDYDGREFTLPSGRKETVSHAEVADGLVPSTPVTSEKQIFIRDSFDSLFYYMAMLEHYTSRTLILAEDVTHPIDYYVRLLASLKRQVDAYLADYRLEQTAAFLRRYPEWAGDTRHARSLPSRA